jgi:hypothetical protein
MPNPDRPIGLVFSIAPQSSMIDAAGALLREGVEITAQLAELGMILGKADPAHIEKLRGLTEFAAIEPDSNVDIGRPDGAVQ